MNTAEVLISLRKKHSLTQQQFADRLFVTRQAVSRWENSETLPGTDILLLISKTFDVSVNTLLGSPRKLICQCCGMPLDDESISREADGSFNEEYCKWCYAEGQFVYSSLNELAEFLAKHMSREDWPYEQALPFFIGQLKNLRYWQTHAGRG